jgi:D-alanine transaminase
MREMVHLNGELLPLEDAKIPVLDRGFIFGDGIYEVIPVYARTPLRMHEHLARMANGLAAIRIANPHSATEWERIIADVIAACEHEDQALYIQVTRGVARRDQAVPDPPPRPTVLVMAWQMSRPSADARENGVAVITQPDFRWLRCDIKSTSLLGNCMLRQAAADQGAIEAVLIRDGHVTEASTSNVFLVKDGRIATPPKDNLILPGITYDLVLELARARGLPIEVRPIAEAELATADELWLSSSTKEVLPVTRLDGRPVGNGRPGPMYARMFAIYQDYKAGIRAAAQRGAPERTAHG